MRAVSTVLDVALFLLLVSAAVVTLAVPAANPPDATAEVTAETLATTTTTVTHAVGASDGSSERVLTASGTHASLLGRAAVANLRLSGRSLAPDAGSFRHAVRNRTEAALAWSPADTGVVAVWEPYPDAPLRGRLAVGNRPPPDVDVSTATVTVPAPVPGLGQATNASADGGFEDLAETIARGILATTLGRDSARGRVADTGGLRERRLRAYAWALDVSGVNVGTDGWRVATDAAVEEQLTRRLAADMRERYRSPEAAAKAVQTGTVQVVVREWSS